MQRFCIAAIALCSLATSTLRAVVLDANFRETPYLSVGSQVTGIAWAPDGSNRLFVIRKTGEIQIVKDGALLPTNFATVSPVYLNSECGLIGICFDPNFIQNGYVYVFATVSISEQQIIRYTAVGDVGTDKTILLPGLPTVGANHDGGAIGIGPDAKLYWSIGDLGNGTGVDGDVLSLAAKVGRANLDGSVPADNPFVDGPNGTNDYIWARGFRNPYTFTFQPETGALWVNCVGTTYEQIFLVNAGDHAGWNDYENNQPAGYITPKIKYRTNGTDTRGIVPGTGAVRQNGITTFTTTSVHGFRVGELITISGVGIPSFNGSVIVASVPSATTFTAQQAGADSVGGSGTAVTLNQGGAVLGGTFYDSTGVPPAYRGNFFYGDFNSGRIMRATLDASNEVSSVDYFGSGINSYIDAAVGPDGALYYANYGGIVYRLAYTNIVSQALVVTPTVVRMVEGGAAAFNVRLAIAPPGDVEVAVNNTSGDPHLTVTMGSTLTFSSTNWSVPQTVMLSAPADYNSTNDAVILTLSASGIAPQDVTVHIIDQIEGGFHLGPVFYTDAQPVEVQLNGEPGLTYILEATTEITAPWTPLSTNTLTGNSTNLVDAAATNLFQRFYRARLAD